MRRHLLLSGLAFSVVAAGCAATQGATASTGSGPLVAPDQPKLAGEAATCAGPREKTFTLEAREATLNLGMGVRFNAWTYNGQLPGPTPSQG